MVLLLCEGLLLIFSYDIFYYNNNFIAISKSVMFFSSFVSPLTLESKHFTLHGLYHSISSNSCFMLLNSPESSEVVLSDST